MTQDPGPGGSGVPPPASASPGAGGTSVSADAAPPATADPGPPASSGPVPPAPADPAPPASAAAGRWRTMARRILQPFRRSRRGRLIAILLIAGFGSALTIGGAAAIQWTETADFCGRCHTMGPELKAHEISPHRELACAECHVEPGVEGWIKAKINGTRQLVQVLTGTFPKPIPPPDHGDLPPTSATCRRCHDVDALVANGGPIKLVLRARYQADAGNTRTNVALVLRPAGFGSGTATRGVHWHIDSDVEFSSTDPRSQTIDLVRVKNPDGSTETFISMSKVGTATNVQPDIDRLIASERTSRMDCIDCHNRVGHEVPSLDTAIDGAMENGKIDPTLPYVKQQALDALSGQYTSDGAAEAAIEDIRNFYGQQYPLVAVTKAQAINASISELESIYRLVATPDMQVSAATYPNNLGHQSSPGCFRCHDGTHFRVVGGVVTTDTIPSACATCHTFPEIGSNTSAILIGQRPASHDDTLWVFDHKSVVTSVDPSNAECGACHTRTYCENCHDTPAVQVPHDDMVYNHAEVVRKVGVQACVFCHQPVYCERCHPSGILPNGTSVTPVPSGAP
jgi:nitrate/TMAO reductase-like tetraheme cytochrome c subunit